MIVILNIEFLYQSVKEELRGCEKKLKKKNDWKKTRKNQKQEVSKDDAFFMKSFKFKFYIEEEDYEEEEEERPKAKVEKKKFKPLFWVDKGRTQSKLHPLMVYWREFVA